MPSLQAAQSFLAAGFLMMVVMVSSPLPEVQAQESTAASSNLYYTSWTAAAFSHRAAGAVCWLADPQGSLRLELLRTPSRGPEGDITASLEALLHRNGSGWTLVLGPDDSGTLNEWGKEWREPPRGMIQLVRMVTTAIVAYPGPQPRFDWSEPYPRKHQPDLIPRPALVAMEGTSPGKTNIWRYQLNDLDPGGDSEPVQGGFRQRMTARGRGSGGNREVVTMTWSPAQKGPEFGVRIHSSRRPGELVLAHPGVRSVPVPEPELFLPLWSMSQFF